MRDRNLLSMPQENLAFLELMALGSPEAYYLKANLDIFDVVKRSCEFKCPGPS